MTKQQFDTATLLNDQIVRLQRAEKFIRQTDNFRLIHSNLHESDKSIPELIHDYELPETMLFNELENLKINLLNGIKALIAEKEKQFAEL